MTSLLVYNLQFNIIQEQAHSTYFMSSHFQLILEGEYFLIIKNLPKMFMHACVNQ